MVDRRGTDLRDLLAFFIGLSLTATGGASANDANEVAALDVGDDYKMLPKGLPNQEEVLLVDGVVWVRNRDGERIREGRGGLRKTDGVLPKVGGCFARIPGEPEGFVNLSSTQAWHPPNAPVQLRAVGPICALKGCDHKI